MLGTGRNDYPHVAIQHSAARFDKTLSAPLNVDGLCNSIAMD